MLSLVLNPLSVGNNIARQGGVIMARRRRSRSYRSKKGSSEVILVLIAFLIFVAFSIIKAIVSAFQNIESFFSKQNSLVQTAFIIALVGLCLLSVWIIHEVKNKRKLELISLQMEREQEEKRQISLLRNLDYLKKCVLLNLKSIWHVYFVVLVLIAR